LGTPTSATLTNATGLPLTTGVTGQLPVANGGTGTATPSIVAGTNVTVTGTWPNQTIASSGSGGGVAYTAVKTANYTAANNDGVLTNTTGGAFTVTLPTSPSVGNIVLVIDSLSQWGTNNLTVDPTALIKIAGNTAGDTLVCDITGATVTLVYTGATYGWNVAAQVGGNGGTAVTLDGTQTLTNKTLTAPTLTAPVLGTPASGTVTNLTGTASININGTVGATTPTTVVATTVKASTTMGVGGATPSASGAGITFPATQSLSTDANTLDDYEEGSWTPTVGGTSTYTLQTSKYTKIGNFVQVDCAMELTLIGTGSTQYISGLPFALVSAGASGGTVAVCSGLALNFYSIAAVIGYGTSTQIGFSIQTTLDGATSNGNAAVFQNGVIMYCSATYRV
jgi:hypothetical protein